MISWITSVSEVPLLFFFFILSSSFRSHSQFMCYFVLFYLSWFVFLFWLLLTQNIIIGVLSSKNKNEPKQPIHTNGSCSMAFNSSIFRRQTNEYLISFCEPAELWITAIFLRNISTKCCVCVCVFARSLCFHCSFNMPVHSLSKIQMQSACVKIHAKCRHTRTLAFFMPNKIPPRKFNHLRNGQEIETSVFNSYNK